jgi:hypothetical protein
MESKIGSVGAGFGARPVSRLAERVGRWQQKRVTWAYLGNGVGTETWRFIGGRKNHNSEATDSSNVGRGSSAETLLNLYLILSGSERSPRSALQPRAQRDGDAERSHDRSGGRTEPLHLP